MLDMKFSIMADSKSRSIIRVSNKQYTAEIDFLGKKEKTLIMKYLVPHLQFLSSGIILYDEMELHLDRNKKFLAYLAHLATAGKQIFVTYPIDIWKKTYSLKGVCEIENRKEGSVVHMND